MPSSKGEQAASKQEALPAQPPSADAANKSTTSAKSTQTEDGGTASNQEASSSSNAPEKPVIDADTQPERKPRDEPAASADTVLDASELHPSEPAETPSLTLAGAAKAQPLAKVLHLDSPSGRPKHPHLEPPPYVHHFDTYTLVKDLQSGGFTQAQSVTLMKAVRSLLAVNMDLARAGLVSKSDVENEMYLFRAACSELRTEMQHARHQTIVRQRSELAHLQHDADILAQRMTQELSTLRDDLKGLFDDRKMSVRTEQHRADAIIEQLGRRIQVDLQSDGRGKVEGLRWELAKRAVIVIGATAGECAASPAAVAC